MTRAAIGLGALLALAAAGAAPADEGWRAIEGNWSAAGRRHTLHVEGGRDATILQLSGSLVLTRGDGLSRGFLAEVIGYDDGRGLRVGRAVWTDSRGDRIFSEIEGQMLAAEARIVGRVTGGTGRYAGLTGEYALTWQYLVRADDGTVQGRTTDLVGRYLPRAAPQ